MILMQQCRQQTADSSRTLPSMELPGVRAPLLVLLWLLSIDLQTIWSDSVVRKAECGVMTVLGKLLNVANWKS
eukprot:CAMPEP_0170625974 /NCGR_PEP_ID=MMETSP0224-20130122/31078_1 /TAXON_ID=285029 /ORGANISM="Togula jolla, Strain CCCM 725" /LENGTH=72 /DNA_ID=CAMNT_0010952651 /DNA_START=33 /DNA_END=249 /DNA_ORIENTATION=+